MLPRFGHQKSELCIPRALDIQNSIGIGQKRLGLAEPYPICLARTREFGQQRSELTKTSPKTVSRLVSRNPQNQVNHVDSGVNWKDKMSLSSVLTSQRRGPQTPWMSIWTLWLWTFRTGNSAATSNEVLTLFPLENRTFCGDPQPISQSRKSG